MSALGISQWMKALETIEESHVQKTSSLEHGSLIGLLSITARTRKEAAEATRPDASPLARFLDQLAAPIRDCMELEARRLGDEAWDTMGEETEEEIE